MARFKWDCFLLDESSCYTISNADLDYAEDVTDESFTNPPIKMTVEAAERGWDAFDGTENSMNHTLLQENLMAVLRGELPEFRLTGVNVASDGIYLVYESTLEPEGFIDGTTGYSGGQVLVYGDFTILFEVEHLDGSPTEQYRVEYRGKGENCGTTVTEYVGGRKRRKLEFTEPGPGIPYQWGRQYCIITEY